jgi:hypothetical protein
MYKDVARDIDFYFAVPVGEYGGFTIYMEGHDSSYNKFIDTYEIDKSVTISRGELRTVERTANITNN